MPYYPTLAEDLARAKEILARPMLNAGISTPMIWGDDIYAAYRLLESFVEVIETMDVTVCELALRARKHGQALTRESITCPRCGRTSYNLNDVRQRFCGACHWFHDDDPAT